MSHLKTLLGTGVAVRLPVQLLLELKECAAKQERTISQEIRYRLVQSFTDSGPTKFRPENTEPLNDTQKIMKNGGQNYEN